MQILFPQSLMQLDAQTLGAGLHDARVDLLATQQQQHAGAAAHYEMQRPEQVIAHLRRDHDHGRAPLHLGKAGRKPSGKITWLGVEFQPRERAQNGNQLCLSGARRQGERLRRRGSRGGVDPIAQQSYRLATDVLLSHTKAWNAMWEKLLQKEALTGEEAAACLDM